MNDVPKPLRKRTPATEAAYETRVRQLYAAAEDRRTIDPQDPAVVGPNEVVDDFLADASRRGQASWNLYRSALLWFFASRRTEADAYETAYSRLLATKRPSGMPPSEQSGPATRLEPSRSIPESDLTHLIDTLGGMNRSAAWGARVQYWIYAGLATGLRPNEWSDAEWTDDSKTAIRVRNSKAKDAPPAFLRAVPGKKSVYDEPDDAFVVHDRAGAERMSTDKPTPPPFRDVPVPAEYQLHVDMHLSLIVEHRDRFPSYYNTCRRVLLRACYRAFGGRKTYSLYTFRGQFAANAKAQMPLEEVRDVMGHTERSGRATMGNYGKRAHAFKGLAELGSQVLPLRPAAPAPEGRPNKNRR